jgi:hypothetical protein
MTIWCNVYRVNTKDYIFKVIQKTNAAYLELHTYTSRWKNSQSFVHTSQRLDMCSASHTADVEMIIQLVPNFVQCLPSDGSYCSCNSLPCTRRKWILGWVVPCEIVRKMHTAQLLHTLSLLTAEHTNSCCEVAIFKTSGI